MASTRRRFAVETTGVRQVQQQLRALAHGEELEERLKPVHTAVAQVLVTEARRVVPHRTGRLGVAIAEAPDKKHRWPIVRAGSKGDVPYAGPIHFGWPTRGLYRASSAMLGQSRVLLESGQGGGGFGLRAQGKVERRRAAVAKRKTKRGKQLPRGGPIKPQPFLYEAADNRRAEILDAYQDGVNRVYQAAIDAGGR